MTFMHVIRATVPRAVALYFDPLRLLWRKSVDDYADVAAMDFFWEIHALVSFLAESPNVTTDTQVFVNALLKADRVIALSVADVLSLTELAKLLTLQSRHAESIRGDKIVRHASFVAGYITGLLVNERNPSRHITSMTALFVDNTAIINAVKIAHGGNRSENIA